MHLISAADDGLPPSSDVQASSEVGHVDVGADAAANRGKSRANVDGIGIALSTLYQPEDGKLFR